VPSSRCPYTGAIIACQLLNAYLAPKHWTVSWMVIKLIRVLLLKRYLNVCYLYEYIFKLWVPWINLPTRNESKINSILYSPCQKLPFNFRLSSPTQQVKFAPKFCFYIFKIIKVLLDLPFKLQHGLQRHGATGYFLSGCKTTFIRTCIL